MLIVKIGLSFCGVSFCRVSPFLDVSKGNQKETVAGLGKPGICHCAMAFLP